MRFIESSEIPLLTLVQKSGAGWQLGRKSETLLLLIRDNNKIALTNVEKQ